MREAARKGRRRGDGGEGRDQQIGGEGKVEGKSQSRTKTRESEDGGS